MLVTLQYVRGARLLLHQKCRSKQKNSERVGGLKPRSSIHNKIDARDPMKPFSSCCTALHNITKKQALLRWTLRRVRFVLLLRLPSDNVQYELNVDRS